MLSKVRAYYSKSRSKIPMGLALSAMASANIPKLQTHPKHPKAHDTLPVAKAVSI